MSIFGISLFGWFGSQSSDIPSINSVDNPLPPCPNSPNCIRITKQFDTPAESTFSVSKKALQAMKPKTLTESKKQWKLETVFNVFFFRDDMVVQATEKDSTSSYLHIRSASRVGESDLGVNTRRVRRFLRELENRL